MTYLELYEQAERKLEHNEITVGEFDEMIKPLKRTIALEDNDWIPCSERLPEESVPVLCCFYNGVRNKILVSLRTDYNYWAGVGRTGDMVAWMPLPPAYNK